MVKKMNKEKILAELMEKTKREKEECECIYDIMEKNKMIGRKNKMKMKQEFQEKLQVSQEEADQLYNLAMEIQMKEILS